MTGIYSKEQRYRGLADGLKLSGSNCDPQVHIVDTANDAASYELVSKRLQTEKKPDGIYCSGDYLAMGAIEALKEKGIPVGTEDGTSVIGSSGFELSAHIDPALTVVQIPMVEMGRRAIRKILEARERPDRRVEGQSLPTKLILRDSTPLWLKDEHWIEKIQQTRPSAYI
jgi:LacI family transcriptional regulator